MYIYIHIYISIYIYKYTYIYIYIYIHFNILYCLYSSFNVSKSLTEINCIVIGNHTASTAPINTDIYTDTNLNNGTLQPFRRKVIQYVAYADTVDELDGHGTHVSGSVAGKSLGSYDHL
jgi:hypothetical protein